MLKLPANRPCFIPAACPPRPPVHMDLVINIKSQGNWASFSAPLSYDSCFIRPGVPEFAGPACQWAQCVPPGSGREPVAVLLAPGAILAPVENRRGVMIIDYDSGHAWALHTHRFSFALDWASEGLVANGSPESDWVLSRLRAGCFPGLFATLDQDEASVRFAVPAGPPPPHLPDVSKWVERSLISVAVSPYAPAGKWDMPLHLPGWTLFEAKPDTRQAESFLCELGPRLHPLELDAWRSWSNGSDAFLLDPPLRAQLQSQALEQSLPAAASSAPADGPEPALLSARTRM